MLPWATLEKRRHRLQVYFGLVVTCCRRVQNVSYIDIRCYAQVRAIAEQRAEELKRKEPDGVMPKPILGPMPTGASAAPVSLPPPPVALPPPPRPAANPLPPPPAARPPPQQVPFLCRLLVLASLSLLIFSHHSRHCRICFAQLTGVAILSYHCALPFVTVRLGLLLVVLASFTALGYAVFAYRTMQWKQYSCCLLSD